MVPIKFFFILKVDFLHSHFGVNMKEIYILQPHIHKMERCEFEVIPQIQKERCNLYLNSTIHHRLYLIFFNLVIDSAVVIM